MTATTQQHHDPRWSFLIFIGLLLVFSCVQSLVGGWNALARKYRSTARTSGKLFPFASMGMGRGSFSVSNSRYPVTCGRFPVSYVGCLFVRVDSAGIALSVLPVFRLLHPKLFIPWNAISECRLRFTSMSTAVLVSDPQMRMLFNGRLGKEIFEVWNRWNDISHPRTGATLNPYASLQH